jgi:hypothetical protein
MQLVIAVGTLVAFLESEILLQSYPPFFCAEFIASVGGFGRFLASASYTILLDTLMKVKCIKLLYSGPPRP